MITVEIDPVQREQDLRDMLPHVRTALMSKVAGDALSMNFRVTSLRFLRATESGSKTVLSVRDFPPTPEEIATCDDANETARRVRH